jgi:hypothetical protein
MGPLCHCSNESLKLIKEQNKQAEWAADQAIMAEYAAQMEKQEAARKAQVIQHFFLYLYSVLLAAKAVVWQRAAVCLGRFPTNQGMAPVYFIDIHFTILDQHELAHCWC